MSRIEDWDMGVFRTTQSATGSQQKRATHGVIPFGFAGAVAASIDLVVIAVACLVSDILYHHLFLGTAAPVQPIIALGAFVFANFAITLAARGLYRPQQLFALRKQIKSVSSVWLLTFVIVLAAGFAFKLSADYSRGTTFAFFATGWAGLVTSRVLLARFLHQTLNRAAFAKQQVLVITDTPQTNTSVIVSNLEQCGYTPLKIVNVDFNQAQNGSLPAEALSDIIETSRSTDINSIFLEIAWSKRQAIDAIMSQLRVLSLPVYLLPDNNVAHFLKQQVVPVGLGWSAELKRAPLSGPEQWGKRGIDIFISLIMLAMLAPLLVLVCIAIKLDSRGPILFLQTRHGFNGRPFQIFKFRSMHASACEEPVQQATRHDPRTTFVGRLLRRTNIDELPQLWNVVRGDMSLVGPRPHAAEHNTEYEKLISNYASRYHMVPGITGWAQIQGLRGETKTLDGMVKRVEADIWYINNWSFLLDLKILFRTLLLGIQSNAY